MKYKKTLEQKEAERAKAEEEKRRQEEEKERMIAALGNPRSPILTIEQLRQRPLPEGAASSETEVHLSDEDFKAVFKMERRKFYELPKWKIAEMRRKAGFC